MPFFYFVLKSSYMLIALDKELNGWVSTC